MTRASMTFLCYAVFITACYVAYTMGGLWRVLP